MRFLSHCKVNSIYEYDNFFKNLWKCHSYNNAWELFIVLCTIIASCFIHCNFCQISDLDDIFLCSSDLTTMVQFFWNEMPIKLSTNHLDEVEEKDCSSLFMALKNLQESGFVNEVKYVALLHFPWKKYFEKQYIYIKPPYFIMKYNSHFNFRWMVIQWKWLQVSCPL